MSMGLRLAALRPPELRYNLYGKYRWLRRGLLTQFIHWGGLFKAMPNKSSVFCAERAADFDLTTLRA